MNISLDNELCALFNIKYPIFLAGLAGIPGVKLTAAVSNAGGLGTLGAAYLTPDHLREAIREIREETAAPFGVNLFSSSFIDSTATIVEVQRQLNRMRAQLGLDAMQGAVSTPDHFEKQVEVLLEEKVPVISTAFGLLPKEMMGQAKSAGARVVTMVTTVQEAVMAEQAGCDAIVAQGSEAGGHRGTFELTSHPMGANIGLMALTPQIVDRVTIPVLSAGGIMDGRGLAAALVLGAQGVQMGTRFLTALESGAHKAYKEALLSSTEESTVLTKAFSGRPARGIVNSFIQQWDASGVQPLPFPTQNTLTRDIRNEASEQNNEQFMSLWAGQGTRMLTGGQTAEEIILKMVGQAKSILGQ
ncbi:NAD(P)H-dependent flavin oxidoreductase [Paenibacillus sp. GCM10027627]|uniref:NAD(P)H-dependent flavin oxidoreductase n=1 Tax=unclassified Paenibacillus TaxID=185978 RepID=UPI0036333C6D